MTGEDAARPRDSLSPAYSLMQIVTGACVGGDGGGGGRCWQAFFSSRLFFFSSAAAGLQRLLYMERISSFQDRGDQGLRLVV